MLGVVFEKGRVSLRDDLPEPAAADRETRVDVLVAGICATDLALARGYAGFSGVPGHEFVGIALEGPLEGRRVVGEINAAPGSGSEDARHEQDRTVLGIQGRPGAFARQLRLPTRNLHEVPDEVATDAAVFAEPLAAALQVVEQVQVSGTRVLVAGDGRLGLLCAHALHLHGASVTVAGRHAERAGLLPERVPHVVGLLEDEQLPSPDWNLAVDATGNPAVLSRLLAVLRPQGTVVVKTTSELPTTLDMSLAVVNELKLVGSRCGRFEPALRLLAEGRVPVEHLIAARYPLTRAPEALEHAARPGVLKVLLDVAG